MRPVGRTFTAAALLLLCVSCGSTSLAAARPSPSPSPSAATTPSPSSSPLPAPPPDYGAPPAGVDLLYLAYPGYPTWLIGYDWTGVPRATVHLEDLDGQTDALGSGIVVAPDGGGFLKDPYTYDRLGRPIYQGAPPAKGVALGTWSEDAAVICGLEEVTSAVDSQGNGTTDFYFVRRTPTTAAVRVTKFLHLDFIPGDMGFTMFACSHRLDRALAVRTVCCGIQGAVVIRISDGAILGTWNRDAGPPVFSPDGQEVADPTLGADGTTASTRVSLVLGGTVLARYGPSIDFQAFSANNRFAVVTVGPQTQVIEVSTRRVVWRDTAGRTFARAWARPGSGDVALMFTAKPVLMPCPNASSSQCRNPLDNVVIVHADGTSTEIPGDHIVPMSWG